MIKTKVCSKCGVEKPETEEFFYFRNKKQKFNTQCKECENKQQKKYYEENQEKIREKRKNIVQLIQKK